MENFQEIVLNNYILSVSWSFSSNWSQSWEPDNDCCICTKF